MIQFGPGLHCHLMRQGGKIYIGTVIGVQDSKKLLENIPNKVRDVLGIIVEDPFSA